MGEAAEPLQGSSSTTDGAQGEATTERHPEDDAATNNAVAAGNSGSAVPDSVPAAVAPQGEGEAQANLQGLPYSCRTNSGTCSPVARKDSRGVTIKKGGKKQHKVAFVDQVKPGASVHEVREVTAFVNGSTGCRCALM